MNKLLAITLTAILIGNCKLIYSQHHDSITVRGIWEIKKIIFPESYEENFQTPNMALFGTDNWASSIDKYFHFQDSTVVTNITFSSNNQPIRLNYKVRGPIITLFIEEYEEYQSMMSFYFIENDKLIFVIDNLVKVTLEKRN